MRVSRIVAAVTGAAVLSVTAVGSASFGATRASVASLDDHIDYVVAISVDGLNPDAVTELGEEGTPNLHRMMAEGASTLNARTVYEATRTLPDHTSMMTGRPADRKYKGHGVMFNTDSRRTTVAKNAKVYIASVFDVAHDRGRSTSLYTTKAKFALFNRTWSSKYGARDRVGHNNGRDKINRYVMNESQPQLAAKVVSDLKSRPTRFTFLHLAAPDVAGHAYGYMGAEYLAAVRATDAHVGDVLEAVNASSKLRGHTAVILTSDHGGLGTNHSDEKAAVNFTVPFMVWGEGIEPADLYALNPSYAEPAASSRPSYTPTRQPIRNGALANLALDLLDLRTVPGSQFNKKYPMEVFTR